VSAHLVIDSYLVMDADGRCGRCRGEMTSGGCPRCDAVRVYVTGRITVVPYRVALSPVTLWPEFPVSAGGGRDGR
jgi:hypothetical protein